MEELLRILEKNARLPVEDIAAMMGKTPVEVAAMMDEAATEGAGAGTLVQAALVSVDASVSMEFVLQ